MEHIKEQDWNNYLAGTCDKDRYVWIQEHLESCPDCCQKYQSITEIKNMFAGWKVDTTDRDISQKVLQAAAKQSLQTTQQDSKRLLVFALKIAAVFIVAITLGLFTGKNSAKDYISQQQGIDAHEEPAYLAAINLQFANDLTWSVLTDASSDVEQ